VDKHQLGPVTSWSFSTYKNFTSCPRKVYYEKVEKQPKPPLDPPPGKDEHPLVRGVRVHEAGEDFIRGKCELVDELEPFATHYNIAREMYEGDIYHVEMEEEWAFDVDWQKTAWGSSDAWLRLKVDLLIIRPGGTEALLVDLKTGRKRGNEISHQTQAQLYQLCAFLMYPELQEITVEFWYCDAKEITRTTYKRSFGLNFMKLFNGFGHNITNEIEFRATPSPFSCKWCNFGSNAGTGVCPSDLYLAKEKP
jgi:CRISPR/Cas system-associated exonuclease Cas4 (RecB family)